MSYDDESDHVIRKAVDDVKDEENGDLNERRYAGEACPADLLSRFLVLCGHEHRANESPQRQRLTKPSTI